MSFIDFDSMKALHMDRIMELIRPSSELGRRYKAEIKPFSRNEEDLLQNEYEQLRIFIEKLKESQGLIESLQGNLRELPFIKLTLNNLSNYKSLEAQDFFEIKKFLFHYQNILELLKKLSLNDIVELYDFIDLFEVLDPDGKRVVSFHLSSRYSEELRSIRDSLYQLNQKKKRILAGYRKKIAETLQVSSIEKRIVVSRHNKDLISRIENSGFFYREDENFANVTFIVRPDKDILKIDEQISEFVKLMKKESDRIMENLSVKVKDYSDRLIKAFRDISHFDWLLAKANFAFQYGCTIPRLSKNPSENRNSECKLFLYIEDAINLPVKLDLSSDNIDYQPVSITFDKKINILTGPNMGGKSSFLAALGQIFYLFAHAIPVPCSKADIFLCDFIYYSGDNRGFNRTDLSSFAFEIVGINQAMQNDKLGVFLIDELARGTNPAEGEAFSRAFLQSFSEKQSFVIASTHYSSLSSLEEAGHFRVKGLNPDDILMSDKAKKLKERIQEIHSYMDYQIEEVNNQTKVPTAALLIAQLLGVDPRILKKAKNYLNVK